MLILLITLLVHLPLLGLMAFRMEEQARGLAIRPWFYPALALKILGGLAVGWVYFYYYGNGDTINYHQKYLTALHQIFLNDPMRYFDILILNNVQEGQPDAEIFYYDFYLDQRTWVFIRVISPLNELVFNNYWVLSVCLSVFAFAGFWNMSVSLLKYFNARCSPLAIVISFLLLPSLLFWGSGVLKESLMIGCMGFVLSWTLEFVHRHFKGLVWKIPFTLVAIWVLALVKFYYAAVFLPILFAYIVVAYKRGSGTAFWQNKWIQIGVFGLVLPLLFWLATFLNSNLRSDYVMESMVTNYLESVKDAENKVGYKFYGLEPEGYSILRAIPKATRIGLFGPIFTAPPNFMVGIAAAEGYVLLILFIIFIVDWLILRKAQLSLEGFSLFVYVLVMAVFLALTSANWGTLMRYKVGFLPFFFFLLSNHTFWVKALQERFKFGIKKESIS